uniref:Angiotensin-converting enzyme n=1 Tax=Piliocolobus tephrosceles TaxID=591936 RepID=A0A8C9GPX8_9PRIM
QTRPGLSLLVLLCYRQLLPCLWIKDEHSLDDFYNETKAKIFLQFYDQTAKVVLNQFMETTRNYVTNITRKNQEEMLHKDMERSQFMIYFGIRACLFKVAQFQAQDVNRTLRKLQNIDKAALPKDELREYNELLADMEMTYSMAQVCLNETACLSLEPELEEVMATSRNKEELLWAWQGWRDAVGCQIRTTFEHYVELSNKATQLNGYKDMGALWRSKYELDTLKQDLEWFFQELRPLYLNLHTYMHWALHRHYGPELIDLRGPIPAHLRGNMWAQSSVNILDLVLPFSKKIPEDVTKIMKGQHWKSEKMFEDSEKFFTSLGLLPAPPSFWKKSMLMRPTDGQEVECHTSAWNSYLDDDFGIKKCMEVTIEDLLSIFHEMGHIQYFLQYKNLSIIFCEGANPAFEEAVGSVITLSASSHKHLLNIGLLSLKHQDSEDEVNFLMRIALEKIKIFDGTIRKDIYNQEWWNLRLKYQGLCPPVPHSEEDFDPGAKFHISAGVYFLSLVLQFQFHETLCKASGHMGPLHQCDIYNSKIAGKLLGDALKLGSSKPWPEVLKMLTGESEVCIKALMTYFIPLLNWLVTDNMQQGDILGWPDFSCSFEEKDTDKVTFLNLKLDPNQAKFGYWVLLALGFVMSLVVLGLVCRLHSLEKQSLTQDTEIFSPLPNAYFLGIAMEPRQTAKRQWMLLGLCLVLMLRTPPWVRAEWWSWD